MGEWERNIRKMTWGLWEQYGRPNDNNFTDLLTDMDNILKKLKHSMKELNSSDPRGIYNKIVECDNHKKEAAARRKNFALVLLQVLFSNIM